MSSHPSLFSYYEMSKCYRIFSVLRNTILFPWKILWGQLILAIWRFKMSFTRHQFSSVTELCPTLWNPMDCSMPGLPAHHQLPEFAQINVHWVCDAIQPSHPVVLFSSCPQSFPASGSFQMSQFFASSGQITRHRPWEILESRNSLEKEFTIYQNVAGEESMDLPYVYGRQIPS